MVVQRGAKLAVRSVPASGSQLSMDLSANGRILTGTWESRPGATAGIAARFTRARSR